LRYKRNIEEHVREKKVEVFTYRKRYRKLNNELRRETKYG